MTALTQSSVMIPFRLPSAANLREHWAVRAKRVKAHRELGWALACGLGAKKLRPSDRDEVIVTMTRVAPRMLDDDNLASCAKGVRDGIADAFGIDDRDPRITWRYAQRKGRPREYAIEVAVERRPWT